MSPPTKPPGGPSPTTGRFAFEEPSSGRARKDVNYVPVPSALKAKVPLPSAATPTDPESAYEDDLIEDMATPTRTPKLSTSAQPAAPPTSDWQPPSTGPMQPISQQLAAAPPPASHRHFTPPPSQQSIGPLSAPISVPQPTSSARLGAAMDAPRYSSPYPSSGQRSVGYASQHGPASQQQITGPQVPLSLQPTLPPHATSPPNTGSYPIAGGSAAPVSRAAAPDEGMPLGYVVASVFFLAIALVGFGLYLAFEVISL